MIAATFFIDVIATDANGESCGTGVLCVDVILPFDKPACGDCDECSHEWQRQITDALRRAGAAIEREFTQPAA